MANLPVHCPGNSSSLSSFDVSDVSRLDHARRVAPGLFHTVRAFAFLLLVATVFLAPLLLAQSSPPRVSSADPNSGKADDTVTLMGTGLGKATVTGVFLSDDKNDYKATIVDQEDQKIVMKVPKVKAGQYNVSIQVNTDLFIEPIHFTVQQ